MESCRLGGALIDGTEADRLNSYDRGKLIRLSAWI